MKKTIALTLALALILCIFAGCGGTSEPENTAAPTESAAPETTAEPTAEPEPVELVIFAAASLTEASEQITELYKDIAPNVTLTFNLDSSGTLKTQIEEGADCDIFLSAGQKQMDQLDIAADAAVNTDGLDFVLSDSRFDFVTNTVVLIVPNDSDLGITSFEDVNTDKVSLMALGNSDVPVGQYAQEIFTNLGFWDALNTAGKITFASNVKEVLSQVESASVDCGVVYSTDAASSEGVTVVASAPEGSHKPITYPAAILKNTKNLEAAEAFMEFMKSDDCSAIFESFGFTVTGR
jgi:molybdate transport system substrate-binding protein